MIRLSLWLLPCFLFAAFSTPISPASSLLEGFVSGYTGGDLPAAGCARPEELAKLSASIGELTVDFQDKRDLGLTLAHAAQLYDDLKVVLSECGLSLSISDVLRRASGEQLGELLESMAENEGMLVGTAAKVGMLLESQDWTEAGKALGEAASVLLPPEVEAVTPSVNFFQKLDNFTAGMFVGFESNPKKPVACLTTYNTTSQYFRNTSSVIEGCVRLYITDCQKIRDMVPDVIIHLQALVLSCKLQDLWASIINLGDPSAWSQIVVAYYWNMSTITATWTDLLQSYMFKKYRQMGVDFGTIIRIVLSFKLN